MHQIGRNAAIAVFLFFATCASAAAASISLFDDSLGTLPSEQGSLLFAGIGGSQTVSAAGVDLNTTSMGNTGQIGYSNIGALELDRSTGVNLSLELQVNVENHATPDRSGFSIIVITNDLYGIELAF